MKKHLAQADVESFIKKSNDLENQGKYSEAIVEISKAIKVQPKNSKLYTQRVRLYERAQDF